MQYCSSIMWKGSQKHNRARDVQEAGMMKIPTGGPHMRVVGSAVHAHPQKWRVSMCRRVCGLHVGAACGIFIKKKQGKGNEKKLHLH